jgi:virulence-associated protein VagC
MTTTRLFKNGRSLAVRIPRELLPANAEAGQTVTVTQDGDRIVIVPRSREAAFKAMLARWRAEGPLPSDERLPRRVDFPVSSLERRKR